jgi:hypothetical protein
MNAFIKYAAKKDLIARMSQFLYGTKPGKHTGKIIGGTAGGILGAPAGLLGGISIGANTSRAFRQMDRTARQGKIPKGSSGAVGKWIDNMILGGQIGTPTGIAAGGLGGAAIGRMVDKKRLAKYVANRKKVNLMLGGGTAGGVGLAALASKKRKKK